MYDVVIVGAGVVGCSIARELSKYKLKICVIEKCNDIGMGSSKANSGIVHAGQDPVPGTLKAKLNIKGNKMYDDLARQLKFSFKRNGSLVLCFNEEDVKSLEVIKERGEKNGVPNMKILTREEALNMEPNLSDEIKAALYLPTGGITCPFEITIALAENAFENGVEFKLNTEVKNIEKDEKGYNLITNKGNIQSRIVVNSAGLFADDLNNMVSQNKFKITPRKGEYCLLDKMVGNMVSKTIFQMPTSLGKGVLVTPTVHGNLLMGPTAKEIEDKTDVTTKQEALDYVLDKAKLSLKEVPISMVITAFSGLRAHGDAGDFIIGEAKDSENFINAAAIESPGLTSAPAIGEMIAEIIALKLKPENNGEFNPIRKGNIRFSELDNEERKKLIKDNPSYGKIVCRCETVTEGEIIDAIKAPLGARDLDGVKRRTRAGFGRCQAGFCTSRIIDILSRELKVNPEDITKFGGESNLIIGGKNKENI